MSSFSTPAILLRRINYGDYDLIVTFFTLDKGKISIIAKSAKKSTKRFQGLLELFSVLQVVWSSGRGKGLPVLQEAALKRPFFSIRTDINKTAYASYWAELINEWVEEGQKQDRLYHLLGHVLGELDLGKTSAEELSILFQMKFMAMSGFSPNIRQCGSCRTGIEKIKKDRMSFDIVKGGLVCDKCGSVSPMKVFLSKGTIKQLMWIEEGNLSKAERIRFSPMTLKEGQEFLEVFVPYCLGKKLKSLTFLKQIRR